MTNIDVRIKYLQREKQRLIIEKAELEARYNSIDDRPKWMFWLRFQNKYEILNNLQMQIRAIQGFVEETNRNLRFLHRAKASTANENNSDT
ncbi:MAG: hypothetical protein LCH91_13730 [Bacteroidetes bacterium]|nr:hypothetical protein [Bacteroidota bacterium]